MRKNILHDEYKGDAARLHDVLESAINPDHTDTIEQINAAIERYLQETKDLEDRIDAYCCMIKEYELLAEARHSEANRLMVQSIADATKAKSLRDHLLQFMLTTDRARLKTKRFSLEVADSNGPQPIKIYASELIPHRFYRADQRRVDQWPDTDRIRQALLNGEEVPGAKLAEPWKCLILR